MPVSRLARAQCQVCGGWFPRSELVRQLRSAPAPVGSNLLAWSGYNASGWTSTATTDGTTAWGCRALAALSSLDDDGTTTTEIDGAPTFKGDGALTAAAAVDLSALTTARFSCQFSPHQADCGGSYTVTLRLLNGLTRYTAASFTTVAGRRVWGDLALADVLEAHRSALVPAITVDAPSATARWAVERIALYDPDTYGDCYVPTSGAAVTRTDSGPDVAAVVTCRSCRDPRLERSTAVDVEHYEPGTLAEDLEVD